MCQENKIKRGKETSTGLSRSITSWSELNWIHGKRFRRRRIASAALVSRLVSPRSLSMWWKISLKVRKKQRPACLARSPVEASSTEYTESASRPLSMWWSSVHSSHATPLTNKYQIVTNKFDKTWATHDHNEKSIRHEKTYPFHFVYGYFNRFFFRPFFRFSN